MDVPLLETDVEVCHRVPVPNGTPKHIIVNFTCKNKHDYLLGDARKRRITCDGTGMRSGASVFVNEPLFFALKKQLLPRKNNESGSLSGCETVTFLQAWPEKRQL